MATADLKDHEPLVYLGAMRWYRNRPTARRCWDFDEVLAEAWIIAAEAIGEYRSSSYTIATYLLNQIKWGLCNRFLSVHLRHAKRQRAMPDERAIDTYEPDAPSIAPLRSYLGEKYGEADADWFIRRYMGLWTLRQVLAATGMSPDEYKRRQSKMAQAARHWSKS